MKNKRVYMCVSCGVSCASNQVACQQYVDKKLVECVAVPVRHWRQVRRLVNSLNEYLSFDCTPENSNKVHALWGNVKASWLKLLGS